MRPQSPKHSMPRVSPFPDQRIAVIRFGVPSASIEARRGYGREVCASNSRGQYAIRVICYHLSVSPEAISSAPDACSLNSLAQAKIIPTISMTCYAPRSPPSFPKCICLARSPMALSALKARDAIAIGTSSVGRTVRSRHRNR